MIRRPPRSTRTNTLLPYTTLFRSFPDKEAALGYASKHFTPELLGHELRKLEPKPKLYMTYHKPGTSAVNERECRQALSGWAYSHLKRGDIPEARDVGKEGVSTCQSRGTPYQQKQTV